MEEIKERIIALRNAIRYARDQQGDDRCWLDYRKAYALLEDTDQTAMIQLPSYEKGMMLCSVFYSRRKDSRSSIPKKIMPSSDWDLDLEDRPEVGVYEKLNELERAVRKHRDTVIEELTIRDDKTLYKLLPEYGKVPVDFTLPARNEFLGIANPCAGCPNFWKSHAQCSTKLHNPHAPGPCQ